MRFPRRGTRTARPIAAGRAETAGDAHGIPAADGPHPGAASTSGARRTAVRRLSLPDPSKPPARRGTRDQAALLNVDVTEAIKSQLGVQTPPWKK